MNVRPNTAVVYPIPFGDDGIFGGGERYAFELARALARETPTRLVTFGSTPRRERIGDLGNLDVRIHQPLRYVHGMRANPLSFGFLRDLRGVDVIHCVAWNTLVTDFSVLYGRLTGKKVFVTDVGGGSSFTLTRWLPVGRWVDGFLLIAAEGGAQFTAWRDRWSILLAGIDTQRFRPAALETERRGVLFVGRLLPHKGIDTLIAAVDPEVPLRIVGRPYHEEYFALLQEMAAGKQVTFVTSASDEEILGYYQTAAVSVLPSVNRTVYGDWAPLPELLGFTLLEAMACGAAVICTRVGALDEVVVDGESGFVVPPSDPAALGDRIRTLLGDPALAARFGAAARRRIEEVFTWEQVARRCLEAYAR
ncbi:MAG TPA: glycosyltransferase family 4 protein [Thermoanaerobaculia bacterium]|jgi:glycosyltransferase involved in cell wall biosynthesis